MHCDQFAHKHHIHHSVELHNALTYCMLQKCDAAYLHVRLHHLHHMNLEKYNTTWVYVRVCNSENVVLQHE